MAHIAAPTLREVRAMVDVWNAERTRRDGLNADLCDAFEGDKLVNNWRVWWTNGTAGQIVKTEPPNDPQVGAPDKRTGTRTSRWADRYRQR
jgi:hypothetical protein